MRRLFSVLKIEDVFTTGGGALLALGIHMPLPVLIASGVASLLLATIIRFLRQTRDAG